MTQSFERLLCSVTIPLLGGVATPYVCFGMAFSLDSLLAALFVAVLICLIPGIVLWGLFEEVWRRRPAWSQRPLIIAAIGALYGAVTGFLVMPTVDSSGMILAAIGAAVGATTGLVVQRLGRRHHIVGGDEAASR